MGTRCTAGCIRMENEALLDVVSIIDEGSTVIIRE
jgi:lipoprotein-anchoring transpeptidase ErfK/SrfK